MSSNSNILNVLLARGIPSADFQVATSNGSGSAAQQTIIQSVAANLNATVTPNLKSTFAVNCICAGSYGAFMVALLGSAYYKIKIVKIRFSCSTSNLASLTYFNFNVVRFTLNTMPANAPANYTELTSVPLDTSVGISTGQAQAFTFINDPTFTSRATVCSKRMVCKTQETNAVPDSCEMVYGDFAGCTPLTLIGANDGVYLSILDPGSVGGSIIGAIFNFYVEYTQETMSAV